MFSKADHRDTKSLSKKLNMEIRYATDPKAVLERRLHHSLSVASNSSKRKKKEKETYEKKLREKSRQQGGNNRVRFLRQLKTSGFGKSCNGMGK